MTQVTVVGITLPFFPMRPRTGRRITAANVDQVYADATSGQWHPQKKLNGDRAVLAIQDNRTMIISRYGDLYRHPVDNINDFLKLPNGTLLDGEVWKKKFYPFEALGVGNVVIVERRPGTTRKSCSRSRRASRSRMDFRCANFRMDEAAQEKCSRLGRACFEANKFSLRLPRFSRSGKCDLDED
jgi:hypothetical protein